MPRAKLNKLYRTFVKGLITEASPLTYPEDSSIDELNTVLSRKGNRTRRMGIRYEEGHVFHDVPLSGYDAVNEYVWHSVANRLGLSFTVIQTGSEIRFWRMDTAPLSDNYQDFVLKLTDHKAPGASDLDVSTNPVHFFAGGGYLFIAHAHCEPIVIEYTPGVFNVHRVVVQIRDLWGVNDGLANDVEPTTLSKEHHYNLLNQGWLAPGTIPTPALGAGETPSTGVPGTPDSGGGTFIDPYTGTEQPRYSGSGGRFEGLQHHERLV